MKKKSNRTCVLTAVLSIVLALSLVPMASYADDEESYIDDDTSYADDEWSYDDDDEWYDVDNDSYDDDDMATIPNTPRADAVNVKIVSWNIKSNVTAEADLNIMAETNSLIRVSSANKYAKKRADRYFVNGQFANNDFNPWGHSVDTKMGTVTLAKKAPANMIIEVDTYVYNSDLGVNPSWYKIVCYKGSKTADIYARYAAKLYTKGKVVKIDDMKIRLNKVQDFKYGKKYAASETCISYTNKDSYNSLIWYGNKFTYSDVNLTAPKIDKTVKVWVKNTKFKGFGGNIDTKSPIYKAGLKEMKKIKSESCTRTAWSIYDAAGVGYSVFVFPVTEIKNGDWVVEPGHDAIYAGGGKQFNGSRTRKQTYISNGPVYACEYVCRTPYAFFRYHKA